MYRLNEVRREIIASNINELISDCISYGGDLGGAYFTEEYYKPIIDRMKRIRTLCLFDHIIVMNGDIPMFAKDVKE